MNPKESINLFDAQRETGILLYEATASGKMVPALSSILFYFISFSMNFKNCVILKLKLNFN